MNRRRVVTAVAADEFDERLLTREPFALMIEFLFGRPALDEFGPHVTPDSKIAPPTSRTTRNASVPMTPSTTQSHVRLVDAIRTPA